ncbi:MAG: peptidylprolyl isomerase [Deltaproteobacteria bacterium]|nr:peptidylprolyl isomerase [Deltaproteobacteria bacterium]
MRYKYLIFTYLIFFSLSCGDESINPKTPKENSKVNTKSDLSYYDSNYFPADVLDKVKEGRKMMKVGDKIIYEGHFNILRQYIPNFDGAFATPDGRRLILKQIIEQEVFYQKALEQNLLESSDKLKGQLWLTRRSLIGGQYIYEKLDQRAKEQYEKDKDKYYSSVEVSDIVYYYQNMPGPTLEEQKAAARQQAENIREGLTAENFGEIAAQETQDPIAKSNFGQVGKISFIDQRVKQLDWGPVVAKAFQMEPGQISEPIETALGIHIIMVTGVKETQPYDHVAPFIQSQIQAKVKEELLQKLLAEKKVEYLLEGLEPPPEEEKTEK